MVVRFEYCREPKLLLIHFGGAFARSEFDLLNERLARFVSLEGTADTIIDIAPSQVTQEVQPVVERGLRPSLVPDRRRVFVIANDSQRGLVHLYTTCQSSIGMRPPLIARSLSQALRSLDHGDVRFEPWPVRPDIFVVEDDPLLAWAVCAQIEDLGYDIAGTAADAPSAVAAVLRLKPSAVLMDIRLAGGTNGLDAARAIRHTSRVPILFFSAHADSPGIAEQVLEIGHAALLGKPAANDLLRASLAALAGPGQVR